MNPFKVYGEDELKRLCESLYPERGNDYDFVQTFMQGQILDALKGTYSKLCISIQPILEGKRKVSLSSLPDADSLSEVLRITCKFRLVQGK